MMSTYQGRFAQISPCQNSFIKFHPEPGRKAVRGTAFLQKLSNLTLQRQAALQVLVCAGLVLPPRIIVTLDMIVTLEMIC